MVEKIRNFSIIAHIDHGKSTLADRFLEITGTVSKDKLSPQYLDQLDLERERGITIKLAPVTMSYKEYVLNLIDTPGHVDFSYEVSRSLSCVEGAILLVDATKGVEAQTLSNYFLAKEQSLKIIPVINKIDLINAQIEKTKEQLLNSIGVDKRQILKISAKTGDGVPELLKALTENIPSPKKGKSGTLKALVFDSIYDQYKGVIAYVRVFDGKMKKGDKIKFIGTEQEAEVVSVGLFSPELKEKEELTNGEIGWISAGLKEVQKVHVGDTITLLDGEVLPLSGYKEFKPMVFAGIFPVNRDDFSSLKDALGKLKLNDASLTYEAENSPALGFGVRAGFLGLLHMEVVQERLEREFDLDLILTSPTVRYRVEKTDGRIVEISNPQELPNRNQIKEILEPWINATIISTKEFFGPISQLLHLHRGGITDIKYFSERVKISCELPLTEIVTSFYDQLKTVSSGYASFDYKLGQSRPIDAVRLDILVAGESVDALSQIVVKDKSFLVGKALVEKLKDVIPRQNFEVFLQAAIGGKIIAAEKIPAFRKDVTSKLYGGDRTRKDKLLKKQKKGKQRMKRVGKVDIPQEAFLTILKV
ncbi:elongation factor 4 [Patescibacteria group bacterium]|nr:elongation factor 4 [Patescibacteria group bacterium]